MTHTYETCACCDAILIDGGQHSADLGGLVCSTADPCPEFRESIPARPAHLTYDPLSVSDTAIEVLDLVWCECGCECFCEQANLVTVGTVEAWGLGEIEVSEHCAWVLRYEREALRRVRRLAS